MNKFFFNNWESIGRTIIISILAYVALIILLRISGKRTLSKMNAFDFIVTVALGSILATVLLSTDVALADGVLAMALLISFQYFITYFSARSMGFSNLIKSTPSLLVYKGNMLHDMMMKERIDEDEIYALVRAKGLSHLQDVGAIVLETDGSLTLIPEIKNEDSPTMKKVKRPANIY
jgi:uncharacterized membrane protein YcaP (DUF421 family)